MRTSQRGSVAGAVSARRPNDSGARDWLVRCLPRIIVIACLAVIALGAPALAEAAGTATIEGTVTAAKTGSDLSDIQVTANNEDNSEYRTTTTAANGSYTFSGLSGGYYYLTFQDPKGVYIDAYKTIDVAEGETGKLNAVLTEGASIVGRVTSATTGAGIGDVSISGAGYGATTNSNGEYRIEDIYPGSYELEAYPEDNTSGYLPQTVKVTATEGETIENIVLKEGGKITGVVTNAYSHAGLGKIDIDVHTPYYEEHGYESYGFAETNANGEYTVVGLPSGSYVVQFFWEFSEAESKACEHEARCPAPYIGQYYSDQTSEATANLVAVTEGAVASSINAGMVPSVPTNTAAPTISGTATAGNLLTCSNGSWTGETELTLATGWPLTTPFADQWLRDGAPITGATSNGYLVSRGDVGHGLACEVTVTNIAGHASARSATIAVTQPSITLTSSKLKAKGGAIKLPLHCAGAACSGMIEISGKIVAKVGHGTKAKSEAKSVVFATGSYSLAANASKSVGLHLTAAAKKALTSEHHLSAKATISVTGGSTATKVVRLSVPAHNKKHHKAHKNSKPKSHKALAR